jgi:hypothetical protein
MKDRDTCARVKNKTSGEWIYFSVYWRDGFGWYLGQNSLHFEPKPSECDWLDQSEPNVNDQTAGA